MLCAGIPLVCERRGRIPSPSPLIRRQNQPNLGGATHSWGGCVAQPHHRDWNITSRVVTITELPDPVVSPAGDCAVRYQRTHMVAAGGDVSDSFVGKCTTSHRDWNITVRVATVTELPVTVVSPAGDCAI